MKRLTILALALALCMGAPAVAYAADAAQPADTQTEEIQVAATGNAGKAAHTTSAATPKTGDPVPCAVPAALAATALVAGGMAARRAREQ